ncbi:MAG: LCP family protein [Clostridia bacterium]
MKYKVEDIYSSSNGPKRPRGQNGHTPPSHDDGRDIYSGRHDDFEPINTYDSADDFYPYDDFTTPPPELEKRGSNAVRPGSAPARRMNSAQQRPGSVPASVQKRSAPMTRYADAAEDIYSNKNKRPPQSAAAPKRKKKKSCCFKLAVALLALFLVLLIALGAGGVYLYNLLGDIDITSDGAVENPYIDESSLEDSGDVTNILLIGVDAREGETKSRSDTMMMVSIDTHNKRFKLTSFLRDTWVDYPDGTDGRLNGASFEAGPQYTIDMIEYTYHIRCDYYAMVDFEVFQTVVDQLGGVDVEVTEREAEYMGSGKTYAPSPPIEMEAGTVHMDGNTALWYSRIRYLDSDYMRTERQRKVVSAIIGKLKDLNPLEMVDLVKQILPEVETNMTEGQIMRFGLKALGCLGNSVLQQQIPAEDTFTNETIRGNAVLVPDLDENRSILKNFLYGTDPVEESTQPES